MLYTYILSHVIIKPYSFCVIDTLLLRLLNNDIQDVSVAHLRRRRLNLALVFGLISFYMYCLVKYACLFL